MQHTNNKDTDYQGDLSKQAIIKPTGCSASETISCATTVPEKLPIGAIISDRTTLLLPVALNEPLPERVKWPGIRKLSVSCWRLHGCNDLKRDVDKREVSRSKKWTA